MSFKQLGADLWRIKRILLYLFGDKYGFVLKNSDDEIIGTISYMVKIKEAPKKNCSFGYIDS